MMADIEGQHSHRLSLTALINSYWTINDDWFSLSLFFLFAVNASLELTKIWIPKFGSTALIVLQDFRCQISASMFSFACFLFIWLSCTHWSMGQAVLVG